MSNNELSEPNRKAIRELQEELQTRLLEVQENKISGDLSVKMDIFQGGVRATDVQTTARKRIRG